MRNVCCFTVKNIIAREKKLYLELGKIVGDISQHEHVILELFTIFDNDFTSLFTEICLQCF